MNSFNNLIHNLKEPFFYLDQSGLIEYVNPAFVEHTGFNFDECKDSSLSKILSISSEKKFNAILNDIHNGSGNETAHFSILNKEGHNLDVDLFLYAERTHEKLDGISGKFNALPNQSNMQAEKDVTQSTKLYEIEEKYKTLYNLTFEGIIIHNKGILIDSNPAFAKMVGYSLEELIGVNVVTKFVLQEYHQLVIDAMKNEITSPYEVLARSKNGEILQTEVESRRIDFGKQSVRVTAIRDITARKGAEALLKESEERYKMLSNLTFEGIIVHNKGVVIDTNQSFVEHIGYSSKEIIGQNIIRMVVLPEYLERANEAIKNEEKLPVELKARRKDGTIFFAESESRMVNYNGDRLRVSAIRDITWRKNTEKKLRENEEELDLFFSRSGDGFFMMKVDNAIYWDVNTDKNQELELIYSNMYLNKINDAMLGQYQTSRKKINRSASKRIFRLEEKEGRKIARELLDQGSIKFVAEELRFDGSTMWIEGNYVVLYDESNKVRGCCGVRRDVTERKIVEKAIKEQNEELKKTNSELDNFVYRVSHDLKAPISSTKGLINIARLETEEKRKSECLEMIERSMNKLDSFILDILDYSRNSRIEVRPVKIDIEHLINDVLSDTHFLRDERNMVIKKKINAPKAFYSDKTRLAFIFNNLISNAIRFSDEGKSNSWLKISIDISDSEAKISFTDNGIGIEAQHLDHIFEMFYRGTETQTGSGLGLYIVKEALEKLSGTIVVYSTVDEGTSFELAIPNMKPY